MSQPLLKFDVYLLIDIFINLLVYYSRWYICTYKAGMNNTVEVRGLLYISENTVKNVSFKQLLSKYLKTQFSKIVLVI